MSDSSERDARHKAQQGGRVLMPLFWLSVVRSPYAIRNMRRQAIPGLHTGHVCGGGLVHDSLFAAKPAPMNMRVPT